MEELTMCFVSQVTANNRKGRVGRTAPGECIRLCTEKQFFADLNLNEKPDFEKVDLRSYALTMAKFKLSLGTLPMPPSQAKVDQTYSALEHLEAVDEVRELTPLGIQLTKLPVDVDVGMAALECADNRILYYAAPILVYDASAMERVEVWSKLKEVGEGELSYFRKAILALEKDRGLSHGLRRDGVDRCLKTLERLRMHFADSIKREEILPDEVAKQKTFDAIARAHRVAHFHPRYPQHIALVDEPSNKKHCHWARPSPDISGDFFIYISLSKTGGGLRAQGVESVSKAAFLSAKRRRPSDVTPIVETPTVEAAVADTPLPTTESKTKKRKTDMDSRTSTEKDIADIQAVVKPKAEPHSQDDWIPDFLQLVVNTLQEHGGEMTAWVFENTVPKGFGKRNRPAKRATIIDTILKYGKQYGVLLEFTEDAYTLALAQDKRVPASVQKPISLCPNKTAKPPVAQPVKGTQNEISFLNETLTLFVVQGTLAVEMTSDTKKPFSDHHSYMENVVGCEVFGATTSEMADTAPSQRLVQVGGKEMLCFANNVTSSLRLANCVVAALGHILNVKTWKPCEDEIEQLANRIQSFSLEQDILMTSSRPSIPPNEEEAPQADVFPPMTNGEKPCHGQCSTCRKLGLVLAVGSKKKKGAYCATCWKEWTK